MRRPAALLLALLALLAPAACGDDDGGDDTATADQTTAPAEDPLAGRTYEATTLEGAPQPLVAGAPVRIELGEDGTIGVETGCNRLSGTYEVEGPILVVRDLAGTEMACQPDLMAQEQWLASVLTQRPVITPQAPDGLVISDDPWTLTMVDAATVTETLALVGPTWTADTILADDAASSLPAGVTATITFADDGTYQVETGCNSGSGTYAEAGAGIYEVDPPTLTRRGCADDAAEVEAAFVATLDGEVTASIEEDRLTLGGAEGAGLSFVGS